MKMQIYLHFFLFIGKILKTRGSFLLKILVQIKNHPSLGRRTKFQIFN